MAGDERASERAAARLPMASIGAVLMMLCASPAFAHAQQQVSVPPADGTVATPPKEVVITFTQAVEEKLSRIVVKDGDGKIVDAGDTHLVAGSNGKQLSVSVKDARPGTYRVDWAVTSVDTHKVKGSFKFTVKP